MCIPYDASPPASKEDHYSYYHSPCRIIIEWVFGEFVARWGLFNCKFIFDVRECRHIINGAFRFHNVLIDWREAEKKRRGSNHNQNKDEDDLNSFRREARAESALERELLLGALNYQEDSMRQ